MCTAEQQAVNIDTQDKQVDFTRWSTNRYHSHSVERADTTHTEEQPVTMHTLKKKH